MNTQKNLHIFLPLYIAYIITASILMYKTLHVWLLVIVGALFLLSYFYGNNKKLKPLLILFLGLFHWLARLNWCLPIYMVFAALMPLSSSHKSMKRVVLESVLYILLYTSIRFTYSPITLYNLLGSGYDLISALFLSLCVRLIIQFKLENTRLQDEMDHLERF